MIDLHTHILPNIDDGASSVVEALKMTEVLQEQNISIAVCTPHFEPMKMSLQEFVASRATAMSLMKESKVTLIPASETVLHEYLFHYSDLSTLCFKNTNYILIELPHGNKWDKKMYKILEKLIRYYDLIPIIAHVERYTGFMKNTKYIRTLINMGCVIQLNTVSIINKKSQKQAIRYIKNNYIDLLGSDCHNMTNRIPVVVEAYDTVKQKLGVIYYNKLKHNAECVVNGLKIRKKNKFML